MTLAATFRRNYTTSTGKKLHSTLSDVYLPFLLNSVKLLKHVNDNTFSFARSVIISGFENYVTNFNSHKLKVWGATVNEKLYGKIKEWRFLFYIKQKSLFNY